nr:glycosyltransferase [Nitratidesulfovibrio vulgaris]
MGRLSPEKGHIHFLRALARARQTEPRLVGLLAGDGPGADMLRREADMLGLAHAVTFAGHVSRVARVYRALDVAVLPSLSEGMPNAALEAMLHGLPVVASHVGGVPEVVRDGETGLLVPPGDEAQLAAALVALCADVERRKALGARGRERVLGHFAPHQRAERILGLYHELLQPLAGEGQRHAKLG